MADTLTLGNKMTLTGYLAVSGDDPESQASAMTSTTPIKWTCGGVDERHVFRSLEHTIIATTNSTFQQLCLELTSRTTPNSGSARVLLLRSSSPRQWSIQIDQFIAEHLSVAQLANLHPTTAAIADHVYFSGALQSHYDLLLLSHEPTAKEIRRRFRLWSTHLHPDRYEIYRQENLALVERMSRVYERLCNAYRILTDERSRAVHDYWHRLGEHGNALALYESNLISALCPPDQDPKLTARILGALSHHRLGRWQDAARALEDIANEEKRNRRLMKFIKSIRQIDDFLNRDSGITSLS